jgi:solute carrier family 25 protein 33/36
MCKPANTCAQGVTASYFGVIETIIQFVLYERLRSHARARIRDTPHNHEPFAAFMLCGGVAKLFATTCAYPHEVIRTRLREEGNKYTRFFQTIQVVYREEGRRAFYK